MANETETTRPPAEGRFAQEVRLPSCSRRWASRDLLGSRGEIVIEHAGREYRLRITRTGKLILTA